MIVVIQCAAGKREDAGCLRTRDGRRVIFVGDPALAPIQEDCLYARPDDPSDQDSNWRNALLHYNDNPGSNPLGLLTAFELYDNVIYQKLAAKFEMEKTYILSAGWGLIPSSFLTPYYDITFSTSAEEWKRRRKKDAFGDFNFLPKDTDDTVVFLGGKDYVPLFARLTSHLRSERTVFFNSATKPEAPGCRLVRFPTTTRTNWHYECAGALLRGELVSLVS
jgi:hypothetical protein